MDNMLRATIKVLLDGQAYLHAMMIAGADAPDEEFQECMAWYKRDHADLIKAVYDTYEQEDTNGRTSTEA